MAQAPFDLWADPRFQAMQPELLPPQNFGRATGGYGARVNPIEGQPGYGPKRPLLVNPADATAGPARPTFGQRLGRTVPTMGPGARRAAATAVRGLPGVGLAVGAGLEAQDVYDTAADPNASAIDVGTRAAEGVSRLAAAGAGAGMGAAVGGVPGALVGGVLGAAAPSAVYWARDKFLGRDASATPTVRPSSASPQVPVSTVQNPADVTDASLGQTMQPLPAGPQQIVSPTGQVSYTNSPQQVVDASRAGATVRAVDVPVNEARGTVSTVPGVSAADRSRAISASLRDREFNLARGMAGTPDEVAAVTLAEQAFDANQGAQFGRTAKQRRLASQEVVRLGGLGAQREQLAGAEQVARVNATRVLLQQQAQQAFLARQNAPQAARDMAAAQLDEMTATAAAAEAAGGGTPGSVAGVLGRRAPVETKNYPGLDLKNPNAVIQVGPSGTPVVRTARPPLTEANIQATMKAQKMTREQALAAYREQGYETRGIR